MGTVIGNGIGIPFGPPFSWASYWEQRLYDSGDGTTLDATKWTVTNPNTTVAEFEQRNSINLYTLNAYGANVYSNNIKSTDSRAIGCWIFSYLDIPVSNYPDSNRRSGLINAANTAGVEFLRDASGDESVLSLRIFTASTQRYLVATTVKDFGIFKITIDVSHNINVYALLNDIWVQQGVEQTWDVGSVSVFMSTKGAANVAGMTKTTLRDVFIRNTDDLNVLPYYNHNRTTGLIPDGATDNAAIANAALLTRNVTFANGIFLLSESLKIPSNRTVYLKNCKILMGIQSLDNFFRNSDMDGGNASVKVIGQGNACLDSNAINNDDYVGGVSYSTYGPVGAGIFGDNVYHYWGIAMVQVTGFEISGLNIIEYNHWCIVPQAATNGIIDDIFFNFMYVNTSESNKDGIDILIGSNNITISNIKGKTEDDFTIVASTQKIGMAYKFIGWEVGDVHDISYENIQCYYSGYYSLRVMGESADNNSLYNISVDNYRTFQSGAFLHVGLSGWYASAPTQATLHDFTFNDITQELVSVGGFALLQVTESCKNFTFTNLVNNSIASTISITAGKDVNGFSVNGVVYDVPIVSTATVENANKDKIVITFSDAFNESYIPATTDFALVGKTISNVAISGTVVTLTVSVAYAYGDSITVDYTKPVSNYLRDTYGAIVATFASQAVTNNILEPIPDILNDGNTVAWFDMNNNVTKDGSDRVSSWGDRSGLGHNLLQSGLDGLKPIWSADGILFDGFNDYMKCTTFDLKQPTMIYAVIKQITWVAGDVIWDGNAAANRCGLTQVTSSPRIGSFSVWTQNVTNDNLAVDTWGIVRAIYNGASSSLQVNNAAAGTGTNNDNEPDGFTLGCTYIATAASNIQVKAIIIRKISDSAGDQTSIYNYLAAKFGLPTI